MRQHRKSEYQQVKGIMEKREIQIAGFTITQLTETKYEADNKEQGLDFYFDEAPDAVEVFVFDSELPTRGKQDPCVVAFYAEDLEDAVSRAMTVKRESLSSSVH
jgi:hypothetical protein